MPVEVQINPKILSWARETAGLEPEEAAVKLGLKSTKKATAADKLLQVENGERPIGRGMLEKAVSVYRRPLVSFYLPHPPPRGERGEDYRTVKEATRPQENADVDALIRDIRTRQQLLREALLEDEDRPQLGFVSSCNPKDGFKFVENSIRNVLKITAADQTGARDTKALFQLLRNAAESAGVFVLLVGDLGSYHSDISEDVFRGIALADNVAPFVVINDNDAVAARSFTLIHELAHIWIGASGVSGPIRATEDNKLELFCNSVAGEFLLPESALAELSFSRKEKLNFDDALEITITIGKAWNISQAVVAFRLHEEGFITNIVAGKLFTFFSERWKTEKSRKKESKATDEAGPSYYLVRRSRLGIGLLNSVRGALESEALTHTKAARILGVAPTSVNTLLQERQRIR